MSDIEIYKKNSAPPKWALKEIIGGRLRGKTDINPQWRYQALTETFGLCGFGWYYEIVSKFIEPGANGEKAAFVDINLYVMKDNGWSRPIPGTGGSMFVSNEKNGQYTNDEAFKMATTDALSVACKMLGIASDIYTGTKYDQKQQPASDANIAGMKKPQNKPLLTDQMLTKAIQRAKDGEPDVYENLQKYFDITTEQQNKFIKEINL